jgi:hypothetical protein
MCITKEIDKKIGEKLFWGKLSVVSFLKDSGRIRYHFFAFILSRVHF